MMDGSTMETTGLNRIRSERGIALAVAIFALVVIGALVSGSFFFGMQEQRVGRNSIRMQQAFSAAEEGAALQVATWDRQVMNYIPVGDSLAFNGTVAANGGWYRGIVQRLNDEMYLIRSEGFSRDSTSRQQLGLLLRLRPIEIAIRAGLETRGQTEIGGNAVITGVDTTGGLLGCPLPSDTLVGVMIAESDSIEIEGSNTTTEGLPPVQEDPTITDSSLTTFGDLDWDDLRDFATLFVPPNTAGTAYAIWPSDAGCTAITNWGEPWYPGHADLSASRPHNPNCEDYFPIVYVDGDLHLNQQRGQGVLIVNGNLTVTGLTRFYGPVVVRGTVVAEGGGSNVPHFYGGVIAADINGSLDSNRVAGNAEIHYSSCALRRALNGTASVAVLQERHWANLN
jgi:hypothetical protein